MTHDQFVLVLVTLFLFDSVVTAEVKLDVADGRYTPVVVPNGTKLPWRLGQGFTGCSPRVRTRLPCRPPGLITIAE